MKKETGSILGKKIFQRGEDFEKKKKKKSSISQKSIHEKQEELEIKGEKI